MDISERSNRTWLCTVVFMDIVGYSEKAVAQQLEIKERFNNYVSGTIKHVSASDRLILDTGDGAALCFFGDPEVALFCAMSLRDAFVADASQGGHSMQVRIGINLGPVKVIKDVNEQLNTIGDGINVAQRVMSFAQPNQIMISRSFYDVVDRLSEEYHQLFEYVGIRKDKHIREHAIYAVVPPGRKPRQTAEIVPAGSEKPAASAFEKPQAESSNVWSPDLLAAVSTQLAAYIGPLAQIIVKKEAKRAADIDDLYVRLAENLTAEDDKKAFLEGKAAVSPVSSPRSYPLTGGNEARRETTPRHQASGGKGVLPDEILEAARKKLVAYVGPIAKVIVKKAAIKAVDEKDFYHRLAENITSEEDKKKFLGDVGLMTRKAE